MPEANHHTCWEILDFLRKNSDKCYPLNQIAQKLRKNYNTVKKCLIDLKRKGKVKSDSCGCGDWIYECYRANSDDNNSMIPPSNLEWLNPTDL